MAEAQWPSRTVFDVRVDELHRGALAYLHHPTNVDSTLALV